MNLKKIAAGIGILSQLYGLYGFSLANNSYDMAKSTGSVRRSRVYYAEYKNPGKNLENIAANYNIQESSETMAARADYQSEIDNKLVEDFYRSTGEN